MEGWIKLNRQITEHWIWQKTPFSWGQAWVDLLLLANHKDDKIAYKGNIITCKKGTVNRSFLFLAERWHWDRRTVKKFLMTLERDGMCTTECTTHRTIITIVNWDKFQLDSHTECTTKCTTKRTTKSQQDVQQSPTYKNDKNDKNVKNKLFKPPTVDEVKAYCRERNNSIDANKFIDFYESKGWMIGKNKMKNWQAAVRTWEQKDKERGIADEVSETEWNPETWNPFE